MTKISIITVCYNCENDVKITLDSIKKQTFKDYELIIVDGNSSDKTLNNIKKYKNKIKNMKIISESDNGVYDAMNKGIKKSTGDFIIFLNMKDYFIDKKILENISLHLKDNNTIYYGNVISESINNKNRKKINKLFFLMGNMINHQTIFAPKNSLKNNPFDLNYKICADKNWLINCFFNGYNFKFINIDTSYYDGTGISSNHLLAQKETIDIIRKYYPKYQTLLPIFKYKIKNILFKN